MKIRLRLFASLREITGVEFEEIDLPADVDTLGALREFLQRRGGEWTQALDPARAIRGAINQRMSTESDTIANGDEVAFFPPVTGG
jgi:molybdopterin synthase sulfur carrier subunit